VTNMYDGLDDEIADPSLSKPPSLTPKKGFVPLKLTKKKLLKSGAYSWRRPLTVCLLLSSCVEGFTTVGISSPLLDSASRRIIVPQITSPTRVLSSTLWAQRDGASTSTTTTPSDTRTDPTLAQPQSQTQTQTQSQSLLILALLPLIWGSQHPLIKQSQSLDPATFTFLRFSIASLASLLLSIFPQTDKFRVKSTAKRAAELAVYMFGGYALQSASLETIPATTSAFLLYLNVKFVPLFERLLFGKLIGWRNWASAATAVAGTLLLLVDREGGNFNFSFGVGELLSVAAAMSSAIFIIRLDSSEAEEMTSTLSLSSSSQSSATTVDLTGATLTGTAILSAGWCLASNNFDMNTAIMTAKAMATSAMYPLLYLSIAGTVLATYVQVSVNVSR